MCLNEVVNPGRRLTNTEETQDRSVLLTETCAYRADAPTTSQYGIIILYRHQLYERGLCSAYLKSSPT